MKCLERYTIEHVKELTRDELKCLWNEILEEKREIDMRHTIVSMLEVMEAKKSVIES